MDENLPASLVRSLGDRYPESAHVRDAGLGGASDFQIWRHAGEGGFILVTKDEDFHRMSVILGPPPKVIWIRLGNCTSESILALLLHEHDRVMAFEADEESAFLALG